MFKTIRAKLLGSFALLTLMVIGLAVYSVINIQKSADDFANYRIMAENNVTVNAIQGQAFASRMNFMRYLRAPTTDNVEGFNGRYQLMMEELASARSSVRNPQRQQILQKIETDAKQYFVEFNAVQTQMQRRDVLVDQVTDQLGPQIERNLTDILRNAQNEDVVRSVGLLLRNLMVARLYGQRFIRDNSQAAMDRVLAEFDRSEVRLTELRESMQNPERIQLMRDTEELISQYRQAIAQMQAAIEQRNAHVENMNALGGQLEAATEEISTALRASQNRVGAEIQALNASIIRMMIIISIIVLLVAVAVAVFIPRFIARGLSDIQSKLGQISQTGNFTIRADDKRTDEIGEMGKAVNQLLSNMQGAISEANAVVSALAAGQFDQRVTKNLSGDLDTLKQGINTSADNIADVMSQLKQAMDYLRKGQFNVKLDTQAKGEYKEMIDTAASSMNAMNRVISEINKVMDRVSEGAFNERVQVEAAGEMDALKTAINDTVEVLEDVIGDITRVMDAQSQGDLTLNVQAKCEGQLDHLKIAINKNAENLARVIASALNNANVVNGASDEVSRGSQDLSQRVQEQAAALEETSATMDEMNSAVQNNTQNAMEATKVARDVQAKAHSGTSVMQQTIEAMNAIQESSHKISEIVTLIDGIAFQTNLLALNAAVEAARAGDHGRGFAVVAGEVRALAQKSAEAAKDIKTLIDESVTRIDQGTQLASESGAVLHGINEAVENVTQMIEHIAQASKEQADGVNQVHKAIADIDQVTQQNAALVEETSAAAESMSEQAQDLSRNMAFFKTGGSSAQPTRAKQVAKPQAAALPKPAAKPQSKPAAPTSNMAKKEQDANEWSEF